MIYRVSRVNAWSVMKVAFVIFAILGFIAGLFYALFFAVMGQMMEFAAPGEFGKMSGLFGGVMGIFMAFFIAIFYAVFGSALTALLAGVYNLLARGFGGIEVHLEPQISPQSESPAAFPPTE